MKKILILLGVIAVASVAVCVVQWRKRDAQQQQLAALRAEAEQRARETAELHATQELLEKQRHETQQQASDLAAKLQAQREATAKAAARAAAVSAAATSREPGRDKGHFGKFLAEMMEDPDTRQMMRDAQRVALDKQYDTLIKQMKLTPEEANQFKDLLADNMMKGAEKASSLFGGDATNRAATLKTLEAEQKAFDEQVQQFLGENRYAQYKDYQQTAGERTLLNDFRQKTTSSESALTDQQAEKLLAFMKEEKQAVAAATGLPMSADKQEAAKLEAMFSGEGMQKMLQAQEEVSQRVYERAKGVLSENQLAEFGKFQTNQLQMMRAGASMMRKFMASGESRPTTP